MGMRGVGLVMALLALSGCGDDGATDNPPPAGGAGGTTLPMAGGGAGGSTAGAGGALAGAGAGAGGAAGGMAGAMAGGGAGSTGMGGGCASAQMMPPAMLHATMVSTFTQMTGPMASCAGASACHQMDRPKAKLALGGATDLRALLVGKMSCEAPNVPLVNGMGGDMALNNSWIWIKMTAPLDGSGNIPLKPEWGTPGADCGIMNPGTAGIRMPYGVEPDASQLAAVRNWICAGAPGP